MEVSGQFHAPVALPLGKEQLISNGHEEYTDSYAVELLLTIIPEGKSL
jgi:hypothetical protein